MSCSSFIPDELFAMDVLDELFGAGVDGHAVVGLRRRDQRGSRAAGVDVAVLYNVTSLRLSPVPLLSSCLLFFLASIMVGEAGRGRRS